ncbi:MAG: tRNA pseudouridine(55) synthase TruB [Isosphaeraceae bacterium]|nr:tRNA pseudouridine(55) synthase TruB [Isosphaeraceae bacterium]
MSKNRALCGVLNLDKPRGLTSRAAVNFISRPLRGLRVGHAGTLDPLASGVLVVCVGAATRLIEYVQRMPKTYRTVVRLGARSETLDADGPIVEVPDPPIPDEAQVRAALARQVGTIAQVPPQFSALKVGGQRAYDLARAGRAVELAARPVVIDRIDLLAYDWPRLELEIDCGSGTYIRSIARDVGDALGCGGLVEVLTRTRIGPFRQEDAIDPRTITPEAIPGLLRPAVEAVAGLPQRRLSAAEVAVVAHGGAVAIGPAPPGDGEVALIGPDGTLVAIAEAEPCTGRVYPRRVLVSGA